MTVKRLLVDISLDEGFELPVDTVYDDAGRALVDYTADDVIEAMRASGSKYKAISDWSLLEHDSVQIDVTVEDEEGNRTRASW